MHSFVGKIFCFKCNFATMDFEKLVNKSISLFSSSILRSPNFESHILLANYKKQLEELNNPSRPWTKSQKHISITYFSLPCLIINSSTPQLSFNIHLFHSLIYTLHIHISQWRVFSPFSDASTSPPTTSPSSLDGNIILTLNFSYLPTHSEFSPSPPTSLFLNVTAQVCRFTQAFAFCPNRGCA